MNDGRVGEAFTRLLQRLRDDFLDASGDACPLRIAIGKNVTSTALARRIPGVGPQTREYAEGFVIGRSVIVKTAPTVSWTTLCYSQRVVDLLRTWEEQGPPLFLRGSRAEAEREEMLAAVRRMNGEDDSVTRRLVALATEAGGVLDSHWQRVTIIMPSAFKDATLDGHRVGGAELWILAVFHLAWERYRGACLKTRRWGMKLQDSADKPEPTAWHYYRKVDAEADCYVSYLPCDAFTASAAAVDLLLARNAEACDSNRPTPWPCGGTSESRMGKTH